MGRINKANLKKTIYYLQRNGIRKTWYAVKERLEERKQPPYIWTPPSESELESQRSCWESRGFSAEFTILVPTHRTKPEYLKELIESLRSQTYPKWELILADATEDDSVERALGSILDLPVSQVSESALGRTQDSERDGRGDPDRRIRYIRLPRNAGIAENTNQALPYATGEYVGLLDHDDVLAENALYEMAAAIEEGRRRGCTPKMLYSDEDKCNGDRTEYYEPNFKEDFNLDLLLSNNYICHFLVMERELIRRLKFRTEYDGAQDYDLVLRAAAELGMTAGPEAGAKEPSEENACSMAPVAEGAAAGPDMEAGAVGRTGEAVSPEREGRIVHIPKVLYHWRCHIGSTAENPRSKRYAYESGRRAIQDFVRRAGWAAEAADTAHVGFYTLRYQGDLFESRADVGAVGGRLVRKGRTVGGRLAGVGECVCPGPGGSAAAEKSDGESGCRQGEVLYENLPLYYSGYLHRAHLPQDAYAVDIRNIRVRPECRELFRRIVGVPYENAPGSDIFDISLLPGDCDIRRVSLELGRALREAGYRILYLPDKDSDLEIR